MYTIVRRGYASGWHRAMRRASIGLCVGLASGYASGWHRAMRWGCAAGCPAGLFTQRVANRIPLAYVPLARLSRLTVERMWRGTA